MRFLKLQRRQLLQASAACAIGLNFAEGKAAISAASGRTHTPIEEQLRRIETANQGKKDKKIAVLGGGMAGLAAAYELANLGHKVTLFEASPRVGGRVWTWRFKEDAEDGHHHELGAMRIPASHDYTRHYIRVTQLSDQLRPFVTSHDDGDCFYFLRGEKTTINAAGRKIDDPRNPRGAQKTFYQRAGYQLSAEHHFLAAQFAPPVLLGALLVDKVRSLSHEDVESLFGLRPPTPTIQQLDAVSLGDFLLKELTRANGGWGLSVRSAHDARELIGATTGLEVWWDTSLGMFLRDELTATGEGLEEIRGGMDRLPSELLNKLESLGPKISVNIKTQVLAIERHNADLPDETVRVTYAKLDYGENDPVPEEKPPLPPARKDWKTEAFDYVLCTIPFPVLRAIPVRGLSAQKMRAIRNLSYASSTKVLLYCEQRFWESAKYNIVGGASFSDAITRATYYPSDRFVAEPQPTPERDRSRSRFTSSAARIGTPAQLRMREANRARVQDQSNQPGVLVASYNWGRDARRMGALLKEQRKDVCIETLKNFHDEIDDSVMVGGEPRSMVRDFQSMFWDQHPWSRAAFCFMRPGDHPHYYDDAIRPEGRLFFAGEHCSLDQGWIQGALISALRAVEEIVQQ